jgi:hypothetical protein
MESKPQRRPDWPAFDDPRFPTHMSVRAAGRALHCSAHIVLTLAVEGRVQIERGPDGRVMVERASVRRELNRRAELSEYYTNDVANDGT